MMQALKNTIAELFIPSSGFQAGPAGIAYARGCIAMAHVLLGAAMAVLVSLMGFSVWPLGIVALYALKEAIDLLHGGRFWDSAEDTCAVWIGAATYAMPLFPVIALVSGAVVMAAANLRE